jgi:hypothetical protein
MTFMCLLSGLMQIPSEVVLAVVSSLGNVGFDGIESRPEVVRRLDIFCILRLKVSTWERDRIRCTNFLWRVLDIRGSGLPF